MKYNPRTKQSVGMDGQAIKDAALRVIRSYQRRAIATRTPSELAFEAAVRTMVAKCRIHFVPQIIFYVTEGISFRADYVFRKYKLAVEIDGPSHYGKKEEDRWRDRLIEEGAGYRTIRFTNKQVKERPREVEALLLEALLAAPHGYKKLLHEYQHDPYATMPLPPRGHESKAQRRRREKREKWRAANYVDPIAPLRAEATAFLDRLAAERKR